MHAEDVHSVSSLKQKNDDIVNWQEVSLQSQLLAHHSLLKKEDTVLYVG